MKDNRIDETLLLKNIELLDSYNSEEKKKLNSIFDRFKSCIDNYKTSNSSSITSKVNSLKSNLPNINTNRMAYSNVLVEVIKRYRETAKGVVKSAKKMESDIDAS